MAKKAKPNREAEKRYDQRALDYAKTVEGKTKPGFKKPGSRKKVGG